MSWAEGYRNGSVLACLRAVREHLTSSCRAQVFQAQLDAAQDYRADPSLAAACAADADVLCKGIKPGGGRVQSCLVRCAG